MNRKRGKIIGSSLVPILIIILIVYGIIKNEPVTSSEKYGQWDKSDLKGNLDIFPERLEGMRKLIIIITTGQVLWTESIKYN